MDIPLRQHALGEPGPAAGIRDRPARATRRREPELGRRGRPDYTVDPQRLVAEHDDEHRIGPVEIDGIDRRTSRGHAQFADTGDGEADLGFRGRVDDDVDRHPVSRDRGPGGSDIGAQPPALIDPHHYYARRDIAADHRTDGFRPIAGGRKFLEDRSEKGEASPPKEVGKLLVAPIPPALIEELTVVCQRLDHLSRQT